MLKNVKKIRNLEEIIMRKLLELEIHDVIEQIELVINYINDNNSVLTVAGNLGQKDCFALNSLLKDRIEVDKPTKNMEQYPFIEFAYKIISEMKIYDLQPVKSSKIQLVPNDLYEKFNELNEIEKYIIIISIYFDKVDLKELYNKTIVNIQSCHKNIIKILKEIIYLGNEKICQNEKYKNEFGVLWKLFYSFKCLGLCKLELTDNKDSKKLISSLESTQLGKIIFRDIIKLNYLKVIFDINDSSNSEFKIAPKGKYKIKSSSYSSSSIQVETIVHTLLEILENDIDGKRLMNFIKIME
ncbi:hypothetical protein AN641_07190 [Candidatus Epulonipiscioides gigas]|nr:hypothetical protein AN641_07190 [Epulopiscium sp. SCG-C07WGA-EpuloA2]